MNYKKLLSLVLVALMVVGNMGYTYAAPYEIIDQNAAGITQVEKFAGTSLTQDPRAQGLKPYDEIRIVVELEDAPVIDTAINSGVRLEELAPKVQASLESELVMEQTELKGDIEALNIDITYHNEFVNVFNGFSATTTYREAQLLEALPNVKRVVISTEYFLPEPELITSHDIINTPETWDLGYKGEGMLIAILDTGVDPRHDDMQNITNPMKAIYEKASELPSGLPGTWFNIKVPYGYNYYDNNLNTLNASSDHGMHVAGTAGANGTLKGVAPEAQILAMKVFGDDPDMPSTFSDIYVKAIEDSLILGADAINMSLGSTASFLINESEDPARVAIRNASESGVIVSVSAGNSNKFGAGFDNPYTTNPDYGVVGSPSLNPETLSVASVENTHMPAFALTYADGKIPYLVSGNYDPVVVFENKDIEYVYCGLGYPADFEGKELTGKIALIQRGEFGFGTKIYNAQQAGAIGVIIFNSAAGGNALAGMALGDEEALITIPSLFVGISDGLKLKNSTATPKTVKFTGEEMSAPNADAGKISSFSSWGVTPNLDFKPEITAPGGQIYSTLQNNTYGLMSGTSMAAPHATGGAALVLQRIDSEFNSLTSLERYTLAKNLLMSTADPIVDKGPYNAAYLKEYTSPRRQGAGVMDLLGATTSNAVVVEPNTGISKVDLNEIGDVTTFQVELQNFGDEPITYEINGTVQTDFAYKGYINNEPQGIFNADTFTATAPWEGEYPISVSKDNTVITEITVPAHTNITLDVEVDLTNAVEWAYNAPLSAVFENGTFVEGFLRFDDKADVVPSIGIPYVGFYGEWDDAPILDVNNYETDDDHPQFYGNMNAMTWLDGDSFRFLGYTPVGYDSEGEIDTVANIDNIAFSPNNDGYGDHIRPIMTFLRNAKEVQIKILDADKKVVRNLSTEYFIRKNFYDSGRSPATFRAYDSWTWDGKINNKTVEGQYYYQISSKVDFEGAEWQVVEYPVFVDQTAPVIETVDFDETTKQLTITGSDNDSISLYYVIINGQVMPAFGGKLDLTGQVGEGAFTMDIVAEDNAYNQTVQSYVFNDTLAPEFSMPTPEPLGIFNTRSILFAGTVKDNIGLQSITINMIDVPFEFNADTKTYSFSQSFEFADGSHDVPVTGTDISGNAYNFERRIFVDTEAPVIEMTQVPPTTIVGNEVTSIQIAGNVSDNYTGLVVKVNGNMLYNHETDVLVVKEPTPVTFTIDPYTVNLDPGENIITVEAKDYAGNITQVEYKVYRKLEVSEKPVVVLTVAPEAYVSSERPAIIRAVADVDVTWEVKVLDTRGTVVTTFESTGMEFNGSWAPADAVKLNGEYSVVVKATKNGIPLPVIDFTETPAVDVPEVEAIVDPAGEAPQIVIQSQEDLQLAPQSGEPTVDAPATDAPAVEAPAVEAPPVADAPAVTEDFSTEITKTFSVYNYPVLITGIDLLTDGSNVVVEAELENLGPSAKDVMLFVQVKNAAGKVVNIATARVSGLADGALINLGSGFGLTAQGAYTVDVFVWFGWDAPTPLSAPVRTVFTIE